MRQYEMSIRVAQVHHLVEERKYKKALAVIETLDIRQIKGLSDLNAIAEVYSRTGHFEEALDTFTRIYRKSKTKRVLHRMIFLAIRTGALEDAETYYQEFAEMNPSNRDLLTLRYRIDKAGGVPIGQLIEVLEALKEEEYVEEWAYELAKLYHAAGRYEDCKNECEDILLWFGHGEIVEHAKRLIEYVDDNDKMPFMDEKDFTDGEKEEPNPEDTGSLPDLDEYLELEKQKKEQAKLAVQRRHEEEQREQELERQAQEKARSEAKRVQKALEHDAEDEEFIDDYVEDIGEDAVDLSAIAKEGLHKISGLLKKGNAQSDTEEKSEEEPKVSEQPQPVTYERPSQSGTGITQDLAREISAIVAAENGGQLEERQVKILHEQAGEMDLAANVVERMTRAAKVSERRNQVPFDIEEIHGQSTEESRGQEGEPSEPKAAEEVIEPVAAEVQPSEVPAAEEVTEPAVAEEEPSEASAAEEVTEQPAVEEESNEAPAAEEVTEPSAVEEEPNEAPVAEEVTEPAVAEEEPSEASVAEEVTELPAAEEEPSELPAAEEVTEPVAAEEEASEEPVTEEVTEQPAVEEEPSEPKSAEEVTEPVAAEEEPSEPKAAEEITEPVAAEEEPSELPAAEEVTEPIAAEEEVSEVPVTEEVTEQPAVEEEPGSQEAEEQAIAQPEPPKVEIDWASLRPEDMMMTSAEVLALEEERNKNKPQDAASKKDAEKEAKDKEKKEKEEEEKKKKSIKVADDDLPETYLDVPGMDFSGKESDQNNTASGEGTEDDKGKNLEFTKAVLEQQKGQVKIVAEDENKVLADEDLPTTRALHHSFSDVLTLIGGELDPSHFVLMGDGIERIVGISKKVIRVVKDSGYLSQGRIARINAKQLNDMDLMSFKEQLKGNCLLVDEASELLFPTITKIFSVMDEFYGDFVVVLADEGKTLDQLFRFAPALAKRFKYIIDISKYTEDDYREEEA